MKHDWTNPEYANLRALDAEIALTIGGWTYQESRNIKGAKCLVSPSSRRMCGTTLSESELLIQALNDNIIPHYTTSVDAALTLVPDGVWCDIVQTYDGFYACIGTEREMITERQVEGIISHTRALAICKAVQAYMQRKDS